MDLVQWWSLDLVTLWGIVIRICEDQRNSIFDLIWASEGLRVQYREELDYPGSDHRMQCMNVANAGDMVCLGKTVLKG